MPSPEYRERLLVALQAVRKAGNKTLEESILCALEGREFSLREALPRLHPEVDEVIFPPSDKN